MSDVSKWNAAFAAVQQSAKALYEKAAASSGNNLPEGQYQGDLVSVEPFTDQKTNLPGIRWTFKVVLAPDEKLKGRTQSVFFKPLSSDIDAGKFKKFYKAALGEEASGDLEADAIRFASDCVGSRWSFSNVQKGEYLNTYVNGIVTA
jgi:hypothetical protein